MKDSREIAGSFAHKKGVFHMASAMNHKKRSHRSEKMHMASARQMRQFSPMAGVTLHMGMGVFSTFGRRLLGWKRTKEKQAAQ